MRRSRSARRARPARTVLFLDEIHRLNRAQQDALLPHVEAGTVTLIGATTENPSFEVIAPLLSRSRVFVLERAAGRGAGGARPPRGDRSRARARTRRAAGAGRRGGRDRARRRRRRAPRPRTARDRGRDPARDGSCWRAAGARDRARSGRPRGAAPRPRPGRALQRGLGADQEPARQRSGRRALLRRAHAGRGRGPALPGAPAGDLRRRGRRQRGAPGADARDLGVPRGRAHRHAGGTHPARLRRSPSSPPRRRATPRISASRARPRAWSGTARCRCRCTCAMRPRR